MLTKYVYFLDEQKPTTMLEILRWQKTFKINSFQEYITSRESISMDAPLELTVTELNI